MTGGTRSPFAAAGTPGRRTPAGNVGIGQVLAELRQEFPDISQSKIRFLEAEGLIQPQRAQSGFRRFAVADIERLRYILTAQRDEYLPLRVIKERLAAIDAGEGEEGAAPLAMTRSELLEAAGAQEALLAELEDYGLLRRARSYGAEALQVVRAAAALAGYGIQPRHLRAVRAAAEREVSLVEQVVAPLVQRASREPALQAGRAVAELIATLHVTLVEEGLADAGLASVPSPAGSYHVAEREVPGLRSASGR